MQNFSGADFAKNLGVISPKIRTATVVTAVETTELSTPFVIIIAKNSVDKVEAVMLTMLLQIKTVLISLSNFSSASVKTLPASLSPFEESVRSLILFAQEYAVSVEEKKRSEV